MSMIKKAWNDPVLSKVIASAIVGIALLLGSYLLGFWPIFRTFIRSVVDYALSRTNVPNWILLILIISLFSWIVRFSMRLWYAFFSVGEVGDWHSYTSDDLFGVHWRWNYNYHNEVSDLCGFCPACDLQVYPDSLAVFPGVRYRCDDCGWTRDFPPSAEVTDRVIREIHRKLRSGEWMTSVQH
jgi:hypothetical protein